MKVTAGAVSMEMLNKLVYAAVAKVKVMGLQYRRDIGKRVEKDVAFLESVGVEV
jgi:phosphoribosylamine-glycine ligase